MCLFIYVLHYKGFDHHRITETSNMAGWFPNLNYYSGTKTQICQTLDGSNTFLRITQNPNKFIQFCLFLSLVFLLPLFQNPPILKCDQVNNNKIFKTLLTLNKSIVLCHVQVRGFNTRVSSSSGSSGVVHAVWTLPLHSVVLISSGELPLDDVTESF